MKKIYYTLLILFSFFHICQAQIDTVRQRIFLVGDAGELQNGSEHPVIDWLKKNVDWDDARNTVIYLGDNIYPLGLPMKGEQDYPEAKKIIDYQINLVKEKKAKGFFVPGNHDWANGKMVGWQRVQNQVNYINGLALKNVQAWPLYGCPGPVEVELDEKVVLVFVDSQWFLHVHDKPGVESNCSAKTVDEFTTGLRDIAERHPNQLLVLAMHHPMYTRGSHGGNYTWKQHIFPLAEAIPGLYIPLPLLGSVYPLTRGVFGNLQDVNHPLYRNMAKQIETVLKTHPNAIQVAGHDHNLQLLLKDSIYYVVSGSGSKLNRVDSGLYTRFEDLNNGFALLEVHQSGKTAIKYYTVQSSGLANPKFTQSLKTILPPAPSVASIDTLLALPATITVAANAKIKQRGIRPFLYGRNYRAEWNEPVAAAVFDIRKEQGGLKPVRRSGSSQYKVLSLTDSSGKEWALRSIEEFPKSIIPPDLVSPFANDTASDALSATYPYAALSLAPLETAAGLPTLRRKLVYVPDDPRLDRFRKDFSSTMAILEEREPLGIKKTYNTDELLLRLAKDNDDHVDQTAVLKTRLLDNFVMDFERQESQWRWATRDTGKGKIYFPVSQDHNQAFFVNEGFYPRKLRKPRYLPEIQGFQAKAYNIKTFNRTARNFDHFFLNELSAAQWETQIDTFLNAMTDEVIAQSLQRQPKEVQRFSAEKIRATLKERRNHFKQEMMTYHAFLSRNVDVVGTNQREQFLVVKNSDGTVSITLSKIDKAGNISSKIYNRTFDPDITQELRLYGLDGNDVFIIQGGNAPILIRIIGGAGDDEFINEATEGKVLVYDVTFEENQLKGNAGFINKLSDDPYNNQYNRFSFTYDYSKVGVSFGFNSEDYLLIGPKFETVRQGFRKSPYSTRQLISFVHALTSNSYRFRYEGVFIKAVGNKDLVVRTHLRALGNTNFFGFGNNTYFSGQRSDVDYYRAKYDLGDASVLVRKSLQSWLQVGYGASLQYYKVYQKANEGKFVSNTSGNGTNNPSFYEGKAFAGPMFQLNINSRNNPVLPTRGLAMEASVRPLFGLSKNTYNLAQLKFDMSIFISLFNYPRFVLATRFGLGQNIGHFEFPQANYLGGNENLRGFRRQRFAGRSMVFNNTELRYRIADFRLHLLPGAVGVLAFHDIGKVGMDGQRSQRWHNGYGGGIWLSPIKRFVLTGVLGFSKEEKAVPLVKVGFLF